MTIRTTSGTPLLQVYDLPTSLAFYRDVLGFEVVDTAPRGRSLTGRCSGTAPCT